MRGKIFLVMFILISGLEAQAEIYRTVDENGRVHFTDSPVSSSDTHSSKNLTERYQAAGYSAGYSDSSTGNDSSSQDVKQVDSKALEKIADDLKKDRLKGKNYAKKN